MKTVSILLALVASAFLPTHAQPRKDSAKVAKIEGFVFGPLTFKDPGCASDYRKALKTEGIAGQKALADLVTYSCVKNLEGIYFATVTGSRSLAAPAGSKPEMVYKVLLIVDHTRTEQITNKPVDSNLIFAEGWIFAETLNRITDKQLDILIEKQRSRRTSETPRL